MCRANNKRTTMKSRYDQGSPRTAEKVTRFQLVTMV